MSDDGAHGCIVPRSRDSRCATSSTGAGDQPAKKPHDSLRSVRCRRARPAHRRGLSDHAHRCSSARIVSRVAGRLGRGTAPTNRGCPRRSARSRRPRPAAPRSRRCTSSRRGRFRPAPRRPSPDRQGDGAGDAARRWRSGGRSTSPPRPRRRARTRSRSPGPRSARPPRPDSVEPCRAAVRRRHRRSRTPRAQRRGGTERPAEAVAVSCHIGRADRRTGSRAGRTTGEVAHLWGTRDPSLTGSRDQGGETFRVTSSTCQFVKSALSSAPMNDRSNVVPARLRWATPWSPSRTSSDRPPAARSLDRVEVAPGEQRGAAGLDRQRVETVVTRALLRQRPDVEAPASPCSRPGPSRAASSCRSACPGGWSCRRNHRARRA